MNTLADISGFFGTVWFVVLIGVVCFGLGMGFKTPVLKALTGGKYGD